MLIIPTLIHRKYHGKLIHIIECHNNFFFIGNEIAKALGYKQIQKAVLDHVNQTDRKSLKWRASSKTEKALLWSNPNDYSPKQLINESGMYSLALSSKTKIGKTFRFWLTHEVLPSIRRTGSYSVKKLNPSYLISDPIKRAEQWIKEQKRLLHFANAAKNNRELADTTTKVNLKLKKIHDTFAGAKNNVSISQFAKILCNSGIKTGQERLFKWLRSHHYLMTGNRSKWNMPYQKFVDQGLFAVSEYTLPGVHKINVIKVQITPKGQQYFVKKFLRKVNQNE